MFIHTSCLGVDTFLVIAGLLTSYTVFIYQDKGIKFIPIMFYLHRYLRLTPVFAIVVLIHSTLLKYLGSGPLWYGVEQHLMNPCRSLWWWALLYVQNYSEERVLVSNLLKAVLSINYKRRNSARKAYTLVSCVKE